MRRTLVLGAATAALIAGIASPALAANTVDITTTKAKIEGTGNAANGGYVTVNVSYSCDADSGVQFVQVRPYPAMYDPYQDAICDGTVHTTSGLAMTSLSARKATVTAHLLTDFSDASSIASDTSTIQVTGTNGVSGKIRKDFR